MRNNIILYDGSCAFCNAFIRRIIHLDLVHFQLCDQQSRQFRPLAMAYSLPQAGGPGPGTIYLLQDGKVYTKTAAIGRILEGCRQPYSFLGWLLTIIPSAISNPVYDWIARRRHKLMTTHACPVPTAAMKERVI
ncbi:thiol-disulfide oxidoreductase DCC family protein [Chitinophaga agrisoli]|nr:DUF393 domain-containing protein [Chitinophaga agrisoli]